jgi:hypothetical protein
VGCRRSWGGDFKVHEDRDDFRPFPQPIDQLEEQAGLSNPPQAKDPDMSVAVGYQPVEFPQLFRSTKEAVPAHWVPLVVQIPSLERNQLLFMKAVEVSDRPWLPDADVLIQDVADLPEDAAKLGASFGLSEDSTLVGIRQVHGHIDLELRRVIGGAGERALVAALEHQWPGSTVHVALENDGYGYDVAFQQPGGRSWHLEMKTTTRQGRLILHLSRQEHDVGRLDPAWRLLVVGLDSDHELECLATGTGEALFARAPRDTPAGAKWQSASYELGPGDLSPGLDFLDAPPPGLDPLLGSGTRKAPSSFAWMPGTAA